MKRRTLIKLLPCLPAGLCAASKACTANYDRMGNSSGLTLEKLRKAKAILDSRSLEFRIDEIQRAWTGRDRDTQSPW